MYKGIIKFKNINEFIFKDKNLIVFFDNKLSTYSNEFLKIKELDIILDYWGIKFYEKNFLVFTNKSENYIYDYSGKMIVHKHGINIYEVIDIDKFIAFYRNEKATRYQDILIEKGKISYYLLKGNNLFYLNNKKDTIKKICLVTGNKSWEINISKIGSGKDFEGNVIEGEISQFIGVYNKIVWVLLNSGKLLGINIYSGEIQYLLSDVKKQNIHNIELRHNYEGCYVPSARNYFHLDIKKGKIIAESVYALWEVDLNKTNPHFEVWGLEDQLQKYQLKEFGYKTFYIENQLFFYDMNSPKWGVIDWDKKEIEWVSTSITIQESDGVFTQIKEIRVANNKVYILDSGRTLHIFEKEKYLV